MSAALGLSLLISGLAGCGERAATTPGATAQQDCERTGGTWRSERCETSSGGGY